MADVTGRTQFAKNVVISWLMHIFVLAAGFIVPRQIDDNFGPELLGIWDLGWVTVRYLSVSSLGVVSALSRDVAMYKAQGDVFNMSQVTSVVVIWQAIIAILVALVSLGIALSMPLWVETPADYPASHAQMVLFLLCISLSVDMMAGPSGGIITACHRWDLQHSINAAQDFVLAFALVGVMLLDGQLIHMAVSVVGVSLFIGSIRYFTARKLMPDIEVKASFWDWLVAKRVLGFGSKTILNGMPHLVVFLIPSTLLTAYAGPAALAMYSRGVALTRHCQALVSKVNKMFVPMISSLLGLDKEDEAHAQLVHMASYSMALIIPMALGLACYGDIVLALWMGEDYGNWPLIALLALGSILPIAQEGVISVMQGLNAHGRIAVVCGIGTLVSMGVVFLILGEENWTAMTAAILSISAWVIGRGLIIPFFLQRYFNVPLSLYCWRAITVPLLCNLPLIACLAVGRWLYMEGFWMGIFVTGALGGYLTLRTYWRYILPGEARSFVTNEYPPIARWLYLRV